MNPNWWQVTTLHKDIREGKFDESVFAADLGDVVRNRGPEDYQDPVLFMKKTYLTKGLENLILNVINRLSGKESGDSVIHLETPFGGGKTHALLTLYHIIKNKDKIKHLETYKSLNIEVPDAKVAVFVGTHADPIKGKTPWGEIADQLGYYHIVKDHDEKRVAPGKERLNEILDQAGPTLILMDEVLEYVVKANKIEKDKKETLGQTLAFLHEITEAIASSKKHVLVLTLPSSILEQYDESAERALAQLRKVSGRVESIYHPVEGTDIYEIIRKRLFEDLGDTATHKKVADWYLDTYQKLGNNVPAEVREITYRDKIIKAYPFHPELIDTLHEKWGSIPTFQRTRGVLRLLAEITSDAYKKRSAGTLIHSTDVNLSNSSISREFIKHIGNEFESIIAADIAGEGANAPQIDAEMGSEYEKHAIAQGLATSIFINSFSGGEKKGITLTRLRTTIIKETIPSSIVGDAIKKLEEKLYFLHTKGNLYSFKNQPTLTKVIVDKEENISDQMINNTLKEYMTIITKGDMETYLWPNETSDIPDNRKIKLVILPPNYHYPDKNTLEFTSNLLLRTGSTFRVYKNTLFVSATDENEYSNLYKTIKNYLALEEIDKDKNLTKTLLQETLRDLKTKIKTLQNDIPFKILSCYRHLACYEQQKIKWYDLGIPTIGGDQNLCRRIKEHLKDNEKILSQITPRYILEKTFSETDTAKEFQEIYETFMKTPGLPLLENHEVLTNSVKQGVLNGLFGLKIDDKIYYKEPVGVIPPYAEIIRKEIAEKTKKEEGIETPPSEKPEIIKPSPHLKPGETHPKTIHITAKIPWDKLSAIIRGVIQPLMDRGAEPEITVEIKATSENGFDRTTLDNKIKETLQQIQAQIKEWTEE
ncbi:MAG: ATPase [Thermoplasmata archaeon]|nr:MAG: ATPase [Thermoplasmata archaeon]